MVFSDRLNYYMNKIGCNAKELSLASGISTSVISRYRSGERVPKYNGKQFMQLIEGFSTLGDKKTNINELKEDLENCLGKSNINFEVFRENLNTIIDTLDINVSDLSKYIGFDSSYLSKIRNGVRIPQHLNDFEEAVIKYIVCNYVDDKSMELISLHG